MKLIIIYGVPATGKLTIAKEVERKTGFKVFHNHAIIDILNEIVVSKRPSTKTPQFKEFWDFARKIRLEVIKAAVKINDVKGLILTIAYTGNKKENKFIGDVIKIAGKRNVYFVKLVTKYKELEKRVYEESRKKYGKIPHKKGLKGWFKKYGEKDIPGIKSLIINTSKLSRKKSAEEIIKYMKK